mmetsp:Transcript_1116/g.3324  ORF Transcript_1116/g.3324 Transcript_1116/m.3324 type:complete len:177 (-) Transcript_1116:144-674(-)
MAVARSTCLRCCLEVAQGQAVVPGMEVSPRCNCPANIGCIIVDNCGLTAIRQSMFNRFRSPRPLSAASSLGPNITLEQFATWRTDSWELVSSKRTVKEDVDVYCVVEWSDIKEFCSFEDIAAGTRDPTQGKGNDQADGRCPGRGAGPMEELKGGARSGEVPCRHSPRVQQHCNSRS